MARFGDRVAIVTGAGAPGGIGAAVARALVAEGGRVVLGATSERVHQRAAELGDAAVGVIADLTVDGAADTLVRVALDSIVALVPGTPTARLDRRCPRP